MMRLVAILMMLLVLPPAGLAAVGEGRISTGRLHDIPIKSQNDVPTSVVIYLSDLPGWTSVDDSNVAALVSAGSLVLQVDLHAYAELLDADKGACLYVVGELTDLAQKAERQLGMQTYLAPIIAGKGEGATFAYAAVADAPANTLGGAVAIGFANHLSLRLPFCPGATAAAVSSGGFSYAFDHPLPEPLELFVDEARLNGVLRQAGSLDKLTVTAVDPSRPSDQLVTAVQSISESNDPFGDLPVTDISATQTPTGLAIFLSGDGGWRDLDKTIGEWMSQKGIHVVGVDSLRYFWSERSPETLARDISRIVASSNPGNDLPVMLIGYSFGADTMALAWPNLDAALRPRTRMIALLAPGPETSFQISVSGWLGIGKGTFKVVPAIAAMPADRVVCVYGSKEAESPCTDPSLSAITLIKTEGGHHFDGDYLGIGVRLLEEFGKRG